MHGIRTLLAFAFVVFLVGTSAGQPSVQRHKAMEIPPDHWNFERLGDLKLKVVRVNLVAIPSLVPVAPVPPDVKVPVLPDVEVLVLVEFQETLTAAQLADLKRRLNQNPGLFAPYSLAFLNADRRVKSVPIGRIYDEMTGRVGDRFEMLFLLKPELHDFDPTSAELRAP